MLERKEKEGRLEFRDTQSIELIVAYMQIKLIILNIHDVLKEYKNISCC